ncbi:MAG: hypothetical protein COT74_04170 [Bdellovibrionales bacterium CG10_big_fil_rev_8_21_14_0_10_45_34]|nr:MAG: hypothetical protein COT74_04170 [Bdellovibrionales bacterium CG10_big_fil_rev_8_21_14_0_10_45_34]
MSLKDLILAEGASLTDKQASKLEVMKQEILRYQRTTNLIGSGTVSQIDQVHFLDSLKGAWILKNWISKTRLDIQKLWDLGSGNGFPGLILATQLDLDIHLVERDKKKAEILRRIAYLMDLKRVFVVAEDLRNVSGPIDFAVSRGFSSIQQQLEWLDPLTNAGSWIVMWKGPEYSEELTTLHGSTWNLDSQVEYSTPAKVGLRLLFWKKAAEGR